MLKQRECVGLFGKWFGHNYVPIWNEEKIPPTKLGGDMECDPHTLRIFLDKMTKWKKVYKGSVCSRCGDRIYCADDPSYKPEPVEG